ncbi:MAG: hypothetical protein E7588_01000 [Ruminococcaceae bacterium]|nr:hypothetical protein [Oscillospiraceae bacterium]
MKKILFVIILIIALAVPTYANVIDEANILSEADEQELNKIIEVLRDLYEFDAVILTVNTIDGEEIFDFADNYYDFNGYGIGENHDGLIFVIAMEEREFATSTCGRAISLFNDSLLDDIHAEITPYLSEGSYKQAFEQYIGRIERTILLTGSTSVDVAGTYDYSDYYYDDTDYTREVVRGYDFYITFEVIVVIVALIIGLIVVSVLKAPMKNIGIKKNADSYTNCGNLLMARSVDRFMYSNVTKTRINNDSNNSGGLRSTTRTGSSGRTHGGRSGRF